MTGLTKIMRVFRKKAPNKVKLSVRAMKALRVRRGIAHLSLNVTTRYQ